MELKAFHRIYPKYIFMSYFMLTEVLLLLLLLLLLIKREET
jgi:hypothetical protein